MFPKIREHLISAWHAVVDHCSDAGKAAKADRHARWESERAKRLRADVAAYQRQSAASRIAREEKLRVKFERAALESTLPPKVFICQNCGGTGHPTRKVQGSFLVEVLLWIFFCLPGLIYSAWRLTSAKSVCPFCEAPNMIFSRSPRGLQLWNQYHQWK